MGREKKEEEIVCVSYGSPWPDMKAYFLWPKP